MGKLSAKYQFRAICTQRVSVKSRLTADCPPMSIVSEKVHRLDPPPLLPPPDTVTDTTRCSSVSGKNCDPCQNTAIHYFGLLRILHDRRPALASMVRSTTGTCSDRLALSSARWCSGMGASWLYRKSSSLQCLSNLFLNVLTFGAVATEFGNSFHTLVIKL